MYPLRRFWGIVYLTGWAVVCVGQEPAFTPPPLEVLPGYTVELVAAPPLTAHPIMAALDDRGRLFVAENSGQNLPAAQLEKNKPNSIRMLEDVDGDGRFDKFTVFADGLTFPQGALWHDGWLYAAVSGGIWRFKDTDDDGVADVREQLVKGFNYFGNAADVHGCFLHPNGRIYWVGGRQGHRVTDEGGSVISQSQSAGGIFSMRPDGSDFRRHATGGFDNPVELVFTPRGETLGTVNLFENNPRLDTLVHWIEGGLYPRRDNISAWKADWPANSGDLLPAAVTFGHVAVSGLTWQQGTGSADEIPPLLVTFFNRNRVVQVDLQREQATFTGPFKDFLWSDHRDFHPTDILQDADGSLLLIDTGGWFTIGCPTSKVAKPQIAGAVYRIRKTGALPLADPRGLKIAWDSLSPQAVADLLDDARWVVRERAVAELTQRSDSAIPVLKNLFHARTPLSKQQNALWAIARMDSPAVLPLVRPLLAAPNAAIRQAAAHVAALHRDLQSVPSLLNLLRDDSPSVRREAAEALGQVGDAIAVGSLLATLEASSDPLTDHSLIYSVIRINAPERTAEALHHPSPAVRRGALIALDQMASGSLESSAVLAAARDDHEPLRRAALNILEGRKGWTDEVAGLIESWLLQPVADAKNRSGPAQLLGALIGEPALLEPVANLMAHPNLPRDSTLVLLKALAGSGVTPAPPSWARALETHLRSQEPAVAIAAARAVQTLKVADHDELLNRLAGDESLAIKVRLAATQSLAVRGRALSDPVFALLMAELSPQQPMESRREAARMLGIAGLNGPQFLTLAGAIERAGPIELPLVLKAFERSDSPEVARAVFQTLRQSPGRWSLEPSDLQKLSDKLGKLAPELSQSLVAELTSTSQARESRLASLSKSLTGGDAERGRQLFMSKGTCFVCHKVRGEGGTIGPDLSSIGAMRSERDLLESIVFPSATFAQGYEAVIVPTKTGETYFGRVVKQTATVMTLADAQGIEHALPSNQVQYFQIKPSEVSLMPAGLDRVLSESELADVIAYMRSLR